jgi:putative nucleotidyltransferase with HDIG domain
MSNAHILLVDDEPCLLEVNKEALESQGYTVFTAANGEEALDLLNTVPADVVVTDLKMPVLGGMGLLHEIKHRKLDVEVIFLTGYGSIEGAVDCLKLGAADYLLKPFNITELLAKVEKLAGERRIRQEQNKIGSLLNIINLSSALAERHDPRSLIREFLTHVRDTFEPDGMAMFFNESEGGKASADPAKNAIYWGKKLRSGSAVSEWFRILSKKLLKLNRPKLIDPMFLKKAQWTGANLPRGLAGVSAIITPVCGGPTQIGSLVILRENGHVPYTVNELQLLTVFASHAGSSFENLRTYKRMSSLTTQIIMSYVSAVEAKDMYTHGHSERVSKYAVHLGRELGLSEKDIELVSFAGLLHDIGKIGIPDNILNKPGPLTFDEFAVMKQHPVVGRDILSQVPSLGDVLPAVYHHHEWYNGGGYPSGISGEDIPFASLIISTIDGFEAMVSKRSYQKSRPLKAVKRVLADGSGRQWDPHVVDAWLKLLDRGTVQ